MDIYNTKPGDKVKYCNFSNGRPEDREKCSDHLQRNKEYVVSSIEAGDYSTLIKLRGIRGVEFNSVMFDNVGNLNPIIANALKPFMP